MSIKNNFYVIDGVTYTKRGWYGCQLESKEKGLRLGDTRVILDQLFYVYLIQGIVDRPWLGFGAPEVAWAIYMPDKKNLDLDAKDDMIQAFYKKLGE